MNTAQSAGSDAPSPTPMRSEGDLNIVVDEREVHGYDARPDCHPAELVLYEPGSSPAPLTRPSIVVGLGTSTTAISVPTTNVNVEATRVS